MPPAPSNARSLRRTVSTPQSPAIIPPDPATLPLPCRTFNAAIGNTHRRRRGRHPRHRGLRSDDDQQIDKGHRSLRSLRRHQRARRRGRDDRYRDQCRPQRRHHAARPRHFGRARRGRRSPTSASTSKTPAESTSRSRRSGTSTRTRAPASRSTWRSTVRVYVDDSFLRACRTGIYANGTNAAVTNRRRWSSITPASSGGAARSKRLEFGCREPSTSRFATALYRAKTWASSSTACSAGKVSHVELINSELTRNTTATPLCQRHGQRAASDRDLRKPDLCARRTRSRLRTTPSAATRPCRSCDSQICLHRRGRESSWPIRRPIRTRGCTWSSCARKSTTSRGSRSTSTPRMVRRPTSTRVIRRSPMPGV